MKKILTIAILGFVCHSLHSFNSMNYHNGDHGTALYEFIMYDYDNEILPLGTTQSRIASNISDAESMDVTFNTRKDKWNQYSWGIGRVYLRIDLEKI